MNRVWTAQTILEMSCGKSGRGLPHSSTLRDLRRYPQGLGVPRSSGALGTTQAGSQWIHRRLGTIGTGRIWSVSLGTILTPDQAKMVSSA